MRFAAVVLLITAQTWAATGEVASLKPMMLDTQLVKAGRANAVIVADEHYRELAETLSQQLAEKLGVTLPVRTDEQGLASFGKAGNVIALGQFANNKLLERLYNRCYLVVDGAQPGSGGCLLQTIHNPDGLSANVVVVGGSDDAGVRRAADQLVKVVQDHGATLPHLLQVELGWGKEQVLARCEEVLAPDRVWPDSHPMEIQQAVAEAGTLYLYTGDERLAQAYKRELERFLNKSDFTGISDDFDFTMVVWDQIEESPVFTDAERWRVTQRLWEMTQYLHSDREINYVNFLRLLNESVPRQNHQARYAGSLYFASRYFYRYYRVEACRQWLDEVARYWQPQMNSYAVSEGTHPLGTLTLNKALEYALSEDVDRFLEPDVLGGLAQQELARTLGSQWLPQPNQFQPYLYWTVAAHRFHESHYLRPLALLDTPMERLRMPWRYVWTVGGSHWDGTIPDTGDVTVDQWITPIKVDSSYYEGTQAYGRKNVPADQAFHSLIIQDPSLDGHQYMSLIGTSLGYAGTEGANAIEFFYLDQQRWMWGGGSIGGRIATAPKHSTLVVVRDGAIEPTPAYVRLVSTHATPQWGVSRTELADHNGVNWTRSIVNVPDRFFLVIDDVTAKLADDYLLESRWAGYDLIALDNSDVVFPRGDVRLRLSGVGCSRQYVRPWLYADYLIAPPQQYPPHGSTDSNGPLAYGYQLARRWHGELEPGDTHAFANLFSVERADASSPASSLAQLDTDHYVVTCDEQRWLITRDAETGWQVTAADSNLETTAASIEPAQDAASQAIQPQWTKQFETRVLSAAAVRGDGTVSWAVGLKDGRVVLLDVQGNIVADAHIEGEPFALTAVDLDGDGRDEVIGGTDTGHVVAIHTDGSTFASWQAPPWTPGPSYRQMFGTWRNVITELHAFKRDGKPMLLAAGTFYYVLDASLHPVSSYVIDRELPVTDLPGNGSKKGMWRTDERTFVMTPADFDGDGEPEIAGEEPDGYLLRVWNPISGERMHVYGRPSDRFLGTAIKSIVAGDLDRDGKQEAVVGLDAFNQQLLMYDYPFQSQPRWSRRVSGAVEAVTLADTDSGKIVLAATEMGQLQAFNAQGTRLFVVDTDEPVGVDTALAAIDVDGETQVWLTTVNGRVSVYDNNGKLLASGHIDGYGSHVLPAADATTILVVSADGAVQCYSPVGINR